MRVAAIIQARLDSTRLPRKILASVAGKPLLLHVVERAARIRGLDLVVVATPTRDFATISDTLTPWLPLTGATVGCFAYTGDPADVLGRYDACARAFGLDVVMRLTADDPVLDPDLCTDVLVEWLRRGDAWYVSNVASNTDGWDCEVFSARRLRLAALTAIDPAAREHVGPALRAACRAEHRVTVPGDAPKLSVDTAAELDLVRAIVTEVGRDLFSRAEALAALERVALAQP